MVEAKKPRVALGIEHMNKDSRIKDELTFYYECPICLVLPFTSTILECSCGTRACTDCLNDRLAKDKIVGLDKDVAICLGGCLDKKPKKMRAPDKIMTNLL